MLPDRLRKLAKYYEVKGASLVVYRLPLKDTVSRGLTYVNYEDALRKAVGDVKAVAVPAGFRWGMDERGKENWAVWIVDSHCAPPPEKLDHSTLSAIGQAEPAELEYWTEAEPDLNTDFLDFEAEEEVKRKALVAQ